MLLRRPIYQRNEGADEDRWCLVFDTDAGRLFVEHEATRGDMRGPGYDAGTGEMELGAFLKQRGEGQRELVRLLGRLFEAGEEAART
jgi:hypothetical protein